MDTGIEVEIYRDSAPTERVAILDARTEPRFLEELRNHGAGSFTILRNDPKIVADPSLLDYRNIVKIRVNGLVQGGFVIQTKKAVIVGAGETADQAWAISGEGLRSWFQDAVVYPSQGLQPGSVETRYFNFASERGTWYNASQWTEPVRLGKVRDPITHWAQIGSPGEWPDVPQAWWVWSRGKDSNGYMPKGFSYFRNEFDISSAGSYSLFFAVDDAAELYVDGELVLTTDAHASFATTRYDMDLAAGSHIIAFKAFNSTVTGGPAGLIAAFMKVGDPTSPTAASLVSYTGQTGAWKALDYPAVEPGWSPGEILLKLLAEANTRGVRFPKNITTTFTATKDSAGFDWDAPVPWSFGLGSTYEEVLESLEELSCDVFLDPADLKLYAWNKRGVDHSTERELEAFPIIFRKGFNLQEADETGQASITNSLVLKTADGWREVDDTSSSQTKYGVIESQMATPLNYASSKKLTDEVFRQRALPETSATYVVIPTPNMIPFVDFNVGDWVSAPDASGALVKRRVVSIAVTESNTGTPVFAIEFDTIFKDRQTELEKFVQRATNSSSLGGGFTNSTGVGNSVQKPKPTGGPKRSPNYPANFRVLRNQGYFAPDNTPRTRVEFVWDANPFAADGTPLTIVQYEVWNRLETLDTAAGSASTGDTSLVQDGWASGVVRYAKVRAKSYDGGWSDFSPEIRIVPAAPVIILDPPTAPILTTALGTVTATWDGNLNPSGEPPLGFKEVRVQRKVVTNGVTSWDQVGTSLTASGYAVLAKLKVGDDETFRLVAYPIVGNPSAPSSQVTIKVDGIKVPDIDKAITDAIDKAAQDSTAALATADGKNTSYYQPNQPTGGTYKKGDMWFDTDDGYRLYAYTGSGWVLAQDAAAADTKASAALTSANGKNTNYYSATTPTAPTGGFKTGDAWFDTANNYALRVWNGSAWVLSQDSFAASAKADTALTTANGKNKVIRAGTQPTGTAYIKGDLWFNSADGNKMYEWSGSAWVLAEFGTNALSNTAITSAKLADTAVTAAKLAAKAVDSTKLADAVNTSITTAQSTATNAQTAANTAKSAADAAQVTANGKGKVYYSTTAPAFDGNGLWIDTANGNVAKRVYAQRKAWVNATSGGTIHQRLTSDGWDVTVVTTAGSYITPAQAIADGYALYAVDKGYAGLTAGDITALTDAYNAGISVYSSGNDTTAIAGLFAGTAARDTTQKSAVIRPTGTHPAAGTGWTFVDTDLNLYLTGVAAAASVWAEAQVKDDGTVGPMAVAKENAGNGARWVHFEPYNGTLTVLKAAIDWIAARWVTVQDAGIQAAATAANTAKTIADGAQTAADAAKSAADLAKTAASAAQTTADGKNKIFRQNTQPTGATAGDTWFDTGNDGRISVYNGSTWVQQTFGTNAIASSAITSDKLTASINDSISKALTDSSSALTSANGKNKNFYQNSQPTSGMVAGDTWFNTADNNKLYTYSGSAWVLAQDSAAAKTAADGAKTAADAAKTAADNAQTAANNAQTSANTKVKTYAQTAQPSSGMTTGDIWVNTGDNNRMYRYSGSAWVDVRDGSIATAQTAANNAQTTANTKTRTYIGSSAPTAPSGGFVDGDLWIDTANGNLLKRWNGTAWVDARDATIATAQTAANNAMTAANGKNKVWHQTAQPSNTGNAVGDTWFAAGQGNRIYEWSGSAWVANDLGSAAIADLAITNAKIGDLAVSSAKISALDAAKITTGTLDANRIGANTITGTMIAGGTVTANNMVAGTITAASGILADAVITTAKIADLAVGTAKIGNTAITTAKINDLAVTNAKIDNLAVTNAKIDNLAVTNAKLDNLAVTNAKIADLAVTSAKISELDAGKITTGYLDAARIQASTITSEKLLIGNFTNLVTDPTFQYPLSSGAWRASTGSISNWTIIDEPGLPGKAVKIVKAAGVEEQRLASGGGRQSVNPKERYSIGVRAYLNNWTGLTPRIRLVFRTASNQFVNFSAEIPITQQGWFDYSGFATVQSDSTIALAEFDIRVPESGDGTLILGNPYWRPAVTGELIVDGAIQANSAIIASGAIGSAMIGDAAITTAKIADLAVTSAKIVALDAGKITTGYLDAGRIQANTITGVMIAGSTVTAANMATGTITAASGIIAEAAIGSANIINGSITNAKIDDLAVTNAKIANSAITDAKIANATILTASIANAAITTAKIDDLAVTNAKISTLDAGKITTGFLDAARIQANAITADKIMVGNFQNFITDPANNYALSASWFQATSFLDMSNWDYSPATTGLPGAAIRGFFGSAPGANNRLQQKQLIDVFANDKMAISGRIQVTKTSGDDPSIRIVWRDVAGAPISSGNTTSAFFPTGAWSDYSAIVTVPNDASVSKASIDIQIPPNFVGTIWLGKLSWRSSVGGTVIEDDAITTNKIAASAITAGKIVSGTITGDKIAANTISVSKLLVTSLVNLVQDAGFEYGTADTWILGANTSIGAAGARTGNNALRINSNTGAFVAATSTEWVAVAAGEKYRVSGWVRTLTGTSARTGVAFRLNTQTVQGGASTSQPDLVLSPSGTTTTYSRISEVFTVPAGVKFMRLQIVSRDTASTNLTYFVDDIEIFKMSSGELIVDGAITADKIDTNAVTASKIAANAVTANAINAGAIDGMVITGAVIQTSSGSNGLKVTNSGLQLYNTSGVQTVSLNSSDGSAVITGTIRNRVSGPRVEINSNNSYSAVNFYTSNTIIPARVMSEQNAGGTGEGLYMWAGSNRANSGSPTSLQLYENGNDGGDGIRASLIAGSAGNNSFQTSYGTSTGRMSVAENWITMAGIYKPFSNSTFGWWWTTQVNGQGGTGSTTFTYGAPLAYGGNYIIAQADASMPVATSIKNSTASGFTVNWDMLGKTGFFQLRCMTVWTTASFVA